MLQYVKFSPLSVCLSLNSLRFGAGLKPGFNNAVKEYIKS